VNATQRDSAGPAEEVWELPLSDATIDGIRTGDSVSFRRRMEPDLIEAYANLVLDHSPLHVDAEYAAQTPLGRRVVHGLLLTSHFSAVVGMLLPGRRALLSSVEAEYLIAVLAGDEVTFSARVDHVDVERAMVRLRCLVIRGHEVCTRGVAWVEVRR